MTTIQSRHCGPEHAALMQLPVRVVMSTGGGLKSVESHVGNDLASIPQASVSSWNARHLGALKPVGRIITCAPSTAHSFAYGDTIFPTGAGLANVEANVYEPSALSLWAERVNGTLSAAPTAAKAEPERTESAAATLRVTRLVALQAVLGLSTSELADVLRITRQGLYKWLDASKELKLQGVNRERLALIERIAKKWQDRSNAPLSKVVHEPLSAGDTAFTRLTADALDETSFELVFDELLAKLKAKPPSLGQRLVAAGFKRRPSLRSVPDDDE